MEDDLQAVGVSRPTHHGKAMHHYSTRVWFSGPEAFTEFKFKCKECKTHVDIKITENDGGPLEVRDRLTRVAHGTTATIGPVE